MKQQGVKRVSASLKVGPHGQPVHVPGYTEIGGIRFYDDELVVGPYGQPVLRRGRTALQEGKE